MPAGSLSFIPDRSAAMGGGVSGLWRDWKMSVGLSGKRQPGKNQVLFDPLAHDSSLLCLVVLFILDTSTAIDSYV